MLYCYIVRVKSIKQFDVWVVEFDPAIGTEIKGSRPAVVISNNIINDLYATVIVALLTKCFPSFFNRNDFDLIKDLLL